LTTIVSKYELANAGIKFLQREKLITKFFQTSTRTFRGVLQLQPTKTFKHF